MRIGSRRISKRRLMHIWADAKKNILGMIFLVLGLRIGYLYITHWFPLETDTEVAIILATVWGLCGGAIAMGLILFGLCTILLDETTKKRRR